MNRRDLLRATFCSAFLAPLGLKVTQADEAGTSGAAGRSHDPLAPFDSFVIPGRMLMANMDGEMVMEHALYDPRTGEARAAGKNDIYVFQLEDKRLPSGEHYATLAGISESRSALARAGTESRTGSEAALPLAPGASASGPGTPSAPVGTQPRKPKHPEVNVRLEALNIAGLGEIDGNARFTIGQAHNAFPETQTDRAVETLFWTIVAAGKLNPKSDARRQNPSGNTSQGKTETQYPAELPEGLGFLHIEAFRSRRPGWWEKLVNSVLNNEGGLSLFGISFSGITGDALRLVLESVQRFQERDPILQSKALLYAFTDGAVDHLRQATPFLEVDRLDKGYWLLIKGSDIAHVRDGIRYFGTYRRLAPKNFTKAMLVAGDPNPLDRVTYAIVKAEVQSPDA